MNLDDLEMFQKVRDLFDSLSGPARHFLLTRDNYMRVFAPGFEEDIPQTWYITIVLYENDSCHGGILDSILHYEQACGVSTLPSS